MNNYERGRDEGMSSGLLIGIVVAVIAVGVIGFFLLVDRDDDLNDIDPAPVNVIEAPDVNPPPVINPTVITPPPVVDAPDVNITAPTRDRVIERETIVPVPVPQPQPEPAPSDDAPTAGVQPVPPPESPGE